MSVMIACKGIHYAFFKVFRFIIKNIANSFGKFRINEYFCDN